MNNELIEHLKKIDTAYNKIGATSKEKEFYAKQVMILMEDIILEMELATKLQAG